MVMMRAPTPSVARGLRRIAVNAPSSISLTPIGRSGMMPGLGAGAPPVGACPRTAGRPYRLPALLPVRPLPVRLLPVRRLPVGLLAVRPLPVRRLPVRLLPVRPWLRTGLAVRRLAPARRLLAAAPG